MKNLLLVYPQYTSDAFYNLKFSYHLGAAYIAAYCNKKGTPVTLFTHSKSTTLKEAVEKILRFNPRVVGFTCYDVTYYFIKLLARELKRARRDLKIIVGGPSATFSDKIILGDESAIDLCVRGDGEQTTYDILQAFRCGSDLASIAGISYRRKGAFVRNPDRMILGGDEKCGGLDVFPSPYLEGVFPVGVNAGVLTSRGCVYHCTYCNFAAMSRRSVRFHSTARVIDELKFIAKECPDSVVRFFDDNISFNKTHFEEICLELRKEKLPLRFSCSSRVEKLDFELLKLMREANFKSIAVGLESAAPRNLRIIRKVVAPNYSKKDFYPEKKFLNQFVKMSGDVKKLRMELDVSIIAGLPKQTLSEAKKTVSFVDRLAPDRCYHDFVTLYPGTPLFDSQKKIGIKADKPKTVLPFKSRFPFDVRKVPLSKFAIPNQDFHRELFELVKALLAGGAGFDLDCDRIAAVFCSGNSESLFRGLADTRVNGQLHLSPVILLQSRSERLAKDALLYLVRHHFPVVNILALRQVSSEYSRYDSLSACSFQLSFLTEIIERRRLPSQNLAKIHFVPLRQIERLGDSKFMRQNDPQRQVIAVSVHNDDDKAHFYKILYDHAFAGRVLWERGVDFCLQHGCQWGNRLCPYISGGVLFIGKKGQRSFCSKAVHLRPSSEVLNELLPSNSARKALRWQVEKKRGCYSCDVNLSCSKCVNTFPFSETEFCTLRKKTGPSKFIRRLMIHSAFAEHDYRESLRNRS